MTTATADSTAKPTARPLVPISPKAFHAEAVDGMRFQHMVYRYRKYLDGPSQLRIVKAGTTDLKTACWSFVQPTGRAPYHLITVAEEASQLLRPQLRSDRDAQKILALMVHRHEVGHARHTHRPWVQVATYAKTLGVTNAQLNIAEDVRIEHLLVKETGDKFGWQNLIDEPSLRGIRKDPLVGICAMKQFDVDRAPLITRFKEMGLEEKHLKILEEAEKEIQETPNTKALIKVVIRLKEAWNEEAPVKPPMPGGGDAKEASGGESESSEKDGTPSSSTKGPSGSPSSSGSTGGSSKPDHTSGPDPETTSGSESTPTEPPEASGKDSPSTKDPAGELGADSESSGEDSSRDPKGEPKAVEDVAKPEGEPTSDGASEGKEDGKDDGAAPKDPKGESTAGEEDADPESNPTAGGAAADKDNHEEGEKGSSAASDDASTPKPDSDDDGGDEVSKEEDDKGDGSKTDQDDEGKPSPSRSWVLDDGGDDEIDDEMSGLDNHNFGDQIAGDPDLLRDILANSECIEEGTEPIPTNKRDIPCGFGKPGVVIESVSTSDLTDNPYGRPLSPKDLDEVRACSDILARALTIGDESPAHRMDPSHRISFKKIVRNDPNIFQHRVDGNEKGIPNIHLLIEMSGSMNGTPLMGGKMMCGILSELARQKKIRGHVTLSQTNGSEALSQTIRLPMSEKQIGGMATADGEGLEAALNRTAGISRDSQIVAIYSDGHITDTTPEMARYRAMGINPIGLYVGKEEHAKNLKNWTQKTIYGDNIRMLAERLTATLRTMPKKSRG